MSLESIARVHEYFDKIEKNGEQVRKDLETLVQFPVDRKYDMKNYITTYHVNGLDYDIFINDTALLKFKPERLVYEMMTDIFGEMAERLSDMIEKLKERI